MNTEYCSKCGLLHDPDNGECEGCKLIAENKMLKKQNNKMYLMLSDVYKDSDNGATNSFFISFEGLRDRREGTDK